MPTPVAEKRNLWALGPPAVAPKNIFYDWLTVHRSITLLDFQLDVQNSYLRIYSFFSTVTCRE
jgi:hypothetical protein